MGKRIELTHVYRPGQKSPARPLAVQQGAGAGKSTVRKPKAASSGGSPAKAGPAAMGKLVGPKASPYIQSTTQVSQAPGMAGADTVPASGKMVTTRDREKYNAYMRAYRLRQRGK